MRSQISNSIVRHAVLVLSAGVATVLAAQGVGCSSHDSGAAPGGSADNGTSEDVGSAGLAVTLSGSESVSTVAWTITGPNGASTVVKQGTVDVSNSTTIRFVVGGLPTGAGYTITLTAASNDGTVACSGSAQFAIAPHATTNVSVLMQCNSPAADAGSASIGGQTFNCGTANFAAASPSETTVGHSLTLTGSAAGPDPNALTYAWSAPSGTFSAPTSATTNFTCTTPGTVTVTLTVGDGTIPDGGVCSALNTTTVQVTCDSVTSDGGASACALGSNGAIKHVIYIQFDNTHLKRDRAAVPSDLEQMPNLLNFIRGKGTMMANDHTVLISHTAGGILSSLTGVYPDRTGQIVSNSNVRISATGGFSFPSSFGYWTDPVAAGTTIPNMVGPDGSNIPAPYVGYTRAGCNVGAVAAENIVLENTGTSGTLGDVLKVFGSSSPQFAEATTSNAAASGTAARALAQTDLVGFAVHCAQGSGLCASGEDDLLPSEPGGYTGFKALFGAQQVDPVLTGQAASVPLTDLLGNPIVDPFNQPGFPGFDGMSAAVSLSYVAAMQEHGIPVTYAYISDAHDFHGVAGNAHTAYGPGSAGYVQQLAQYDAAFGAFFNRLAADGIDKTNTLFVFTVDEGDHFVGGSPTPANCDGVTIPCDWTTNNQVGEIQANIDTLVTHQFPTLASTFLGSGPDTFTVHGDDAPTFYLAKKGVGALSQTDPDTRNFERTIAGLTAVNPYTGNTDKLLVQMLDQTGMKGLHMYTSGDLARNPTFVFFADADYFITDFPSSTCESCIGPAFAWNHGDIQPEIGQTWLGMVGPGVKNQPDVMTFTDHTDVRPTINSILGLHDSYQLDGRVITQALQPSAFAASLAANQSTVEALGDSYKQINAPFGPFSFSVMTASTAALQGDDPTYASLEASIANLVTRRDTLVSAIKSALDGAEFGNTPIDSTQAQAWIAQAQALLSDAAALASSAGSGVPDAGTDATAPDAGTDATAPDAGTDATTPDATTPDASAPDAGGTAVNLKVYRVGDGSAALAGVATPVFIDEFTPTGTLVTSTPMPTTAVGLGHRLVASGSSTAEGLITRSTDGKFLLIPGYDAAVGTAGVASTAAMTVNRVIGRLDAAGNLDTSTALNDFADTGSPRSVASVDGSQFWFGGSTGGVRFAPLGSLTSTQLSTTVLNMRQIAIFGGQLFADDASGSAVRVGAVGSGLPTTAGQTIVNLPGFATSGGSPYGFFFADLDAGTPGLDTLYVADDGAGVTKYSLVSGNWTANGTVGASTDTYRGLTGIATGTSVALFATRKAGELVSLTDASGYNGTLTGSPVSLAIAPTNTAFRGVALAPQP
jgi:hypothetical protein